MILKNTLKKIYLFFYKKNLKTKFNLKFGENIYINKSTQFEGYNYLSNNSALVSSYIGFASYIGEDSKISFTKIGKYTSIGPNVKCIFGNHPSNTFVSTHPAFFSLRKQVGFTFVNKQLFSEFKPPIEKNKPYTIVIGNDVWIGAEVKILDGVKIGDGAIIAAGSLVNKNVAPYSIVGGIPAKHIKKRFSDKEINFLINFKWWDKEMNWLKQNVSKFSCIEGFSKAYAND